jgi:hypothetical protein
MFSFTPQLKRESV